jgi:nicotinamidase-related amidase
VLGTIVDSYFRGYDCVVLRDCVATTSPAGAYESVLYNSVNVSIAFERYDLLVFPRLPNY